MPEIVRERDRLGEFLIEAECARDGARDLRGLERMRQASAVVIALVIHKHLGFVFEASKRGRMNDAVAIARKDGAHRMLGFGKAAPATGPRRHRIRRQHARRYLLELLPRPQHYVQQPRCYHAANGARSARHDIAQHVQSYARGRGFL